MKGHESLEVYPLFFLIIFLLFYLFIYFFEKCKIYLQTLITSGKYLQRPNKKIAHKSSKKNIKTNTLSMTLDFGGKKKLSFFFWKLLLFFLIAFFLKKKLYLQTN